VDGLNQVAALLDLAPLEHEGGLFRQTHADQWSSSIYYAVGGDEFSALHRLSSAEVYHYYAGDPLNLLVLYPDGASDQVTLGPDLARGQRPQFRVAPGAWQGSTSSGAWSLVGTTMAPPFAWDGFELGSAALAVRYPTLAGRIKELVR
jgi:predicted cupin superfamily sugar epimerase